MDYTYHYNGSAGQSHTHVLLVPPVDFTPKNLIEKYNVTEGIHAIRAYSKG